MGNRVSVKQYIFLGVLYSIGNVYVVIGSVQYQLDYWQSFLIGALLSVPFLFIYSQIQKMYPGENLFNIFIAVFGKVWGRVCTALFLFYVTYLGALSLRSCSEFIVILNLTRTPTIAVMAIIILICIMMARCGINVIGKMTLYLLPISAVIAIGTFLCAIQFADFSNIFPIAIQEKNMFLNKIFANGAIPFGELVVLTTVMTRDKEKKSNFWPIISTAAITAFFALLIYFRNIIVLGQSSRGIFYFPSYESVSVISVGSFLFRIEILIGIYLITNAIVRIGILVTSCAEGLATLFNCGSQRDMATPAGALIIALAAALFKNTEQLTEWVEYYPYFSIPFQIILPIIVLIGAIIKSRQQQNGLPISHVKNKIGEES